MNWLQRKWAAFNNMPFIEGDSGSESLKFSKRKEHDSSRISRHDMWRKQYVNMPYLRDLSKEQLLDHGKQLFQETLPAFIRGAHKKPSQDKIFELVEQGTHFIEEMNIRGIDFREFSPELQEAFRRLQQESKLEI